MLDHRLQRALLAPQLLRALGLVPDLGVLQRGVDFVQSQRFAVVVKDTPGARRCARRGRSAECRWQLMRSMSMVGFCNRGAIFACAAMPCSGKDRPDARPAVRENAARSFMPRGCDERAGRRSAGDPLALAGHAAGGAVVDAGLGAGDVSCRRCSRPSRSRSPVRRRECGSPR